MEHEDVLGGLSLPARFESVRLLGRGGMGAVFLASDRFLSRQVAIKVLAPELASDPVARERFAREAALAGRLGSHRHIVTAHEAAEWDGRPYVVFEYMPNGSLAERLRDSGAPPRSQALRWLGQAAEALDYAHAAKVVHRDVKPSNLLLDAQEDICIADFGVSRRHGETTLTGQGEIVGTEGYLAPEQVTGRGATTSSDRFALAVVAHQLLTGELPPANPAGLGAEVDAVFEQALADQPDRRFPTASSFVDALQTALVADPAPTLPTPTRRRLLPPQTTPGSGRVPAPSRVFSRHRQRRRAWRVAAFLVAALVVAAPATAGGLALGRRLAREHTPQAHHRAEVSRCAVSQFGADANLVVVGVGATRFCRLQAETLSAQGAAWSYRTGTRLQAPDSGDPHGLARVCTLARGRLTAAVYDDLGQAIGHDLCQTYAASGWALRSYS